MARAGYPARMTYSIVARDPLTGRFGVAVQSHAYTVGPIVPWLEAGVGAVATQATVNVVASGRSPSRCCATAGARSG